MFLEKYAHLIRNNAPLKEAISDILKPHLDSVVDRMTDRMSNTISYLVAGIFFMGVGIGSLSTYILIK